MADPEWRGDDAASPVGAPLPACVPVHPRWALSAAAAVSTDGPCSDWFDSFALPDGRLVLVLGDVAGRGPVAAATVSRLRGALLLALTEDPDPGRALERLAGLARHVPEAVGTTVLTAVADPAGEQVRYASAGHPPPLHVSIGGAITSWDVEDGACLGVGAHFPVTTLAMAPGDLLLLASDGLPGATGGPSPDALRRLGGPVAEVQQGSVDDQAATEESCLEVLRCTGQGGGFDDDAVALAVRRRAWPAEPLSMCLPAIPDTVAVVRHELADWLDLTGAGAIDASSILQAVAELVTNAVEHAYPPGTDHRATRVDVSCAMAADGGVDVVVSDTGSWRDERRSDDAPETFGSRGRGLYLARAFVDHLTVSRTAHGTVCRVLHRPMRPVTLVPARSSVPTGDGTAVKFDTTLDGGRLLVGGAVDHAAADRLRLAIGRASQGATRPVEVDLSGVTLLTSAAIGALIDAGAADRDGAVTLRADAGSPAARVLVRVGLPCS